MMRKLSCALIVLGLLSPVVYAQSLSDQISSLKAVQDQQEAAENDARLRMEAQQREYERQVAAERRSIAASAKQAQAAKEKKAQQKMAAAEAEKKRNQDYEDKLRDMELEDRRLALDEKKAKVKRADEYIDEDLNAKAAQTDVVQANADATRDLSSGTKSLLEKTGDAEVKKESGLFSK